MQAHLPWLLLSTGKVLFIACLLQKETGARLELSGKISAHDDDLSQCDTMDASPIQQSVALIHLIFHSNLIFHIRVKNQIISCACGLEQRPNSRLLASAAQGAQRIGNKLSGTRARARNQANESSV